MSKEYTRALAILGLLPVAGSVIIHDDFEGINNWTKGGTSGDFIFELDPSIAKQGNQSLHLKTRTTSAATNDVISAIRYFHLLPSKVMSFISSFRFPDYTKILHIDFLFEWYDGASSRICHAKFSPNTPKWEYYDAATAYQPITGFNIKLEDAYWHNIQFIANFATDKYLSLQVDHLLADLSSFSFYSGAPAVDSGLLVRIEIKAIGNNPAELSIDELMLHELG